MDKTRISKFITSRSGVQNGRPCLRGTRIPVYVILEALATGMKTEKVLNEFAPITAEQVRACLYYAALNADEEEILRSN